MLHNQIGLGSKIALSCPQTCSLITIQKEIGFDLLLNESRYIQKDGQKLALVGVENWGKGGFKKAGDLDKASSNIAAGDFKILLSRCFVKDNTNH